MSKATGVCRAKGGSMHLTKASAGMLGSYAIVGAHLPMAAGAAWSAQLRGTGQVAVAFFGDGATNIGAFHEALNLAAVWSLPVLFVCENNLYMEYTPIGSVTAVPQPGRRPGRRYGLQAEVIDGNDVVAVAAAVGAGRGAGPGRRRARAASRRVTYRHFGHSRTDPAKYRPAEEVEQWLTTRPAGRGPQPGWRTSGCRPTAADAADERAGSRWPRPSSGAPRPRRPPIPGRRFDRRMGGRRLGMADVSAAQVTYREAVAEGIARELRRDSVGGVPGRGHRRGRGRVQDHRRACSRSSAGSGSGTPRSPSRPSWAWRWARR